MAEKEELQWITVNGKHIPIKPGESKKEAISKAFGEDRDGFDGENSDKETYDNYMKEAAEETARVNTGKQKKVKGQGVNIESDELKKKYMITDSEGQSLGEIEASSEQEAFNKASEQFPGRGEELFVDEIEEDDEESSPMNEFSGPDREGPSFAQLDNLKKYADRYGYDFNEIKNEFDRRVKDAKEKQGFTSDKDAMSAAYESLTDDMVEANGKDFIKKELSLEDAIKSADDDVLDSQFGKDTPERKLAGAIKGSGESQSNDEHTQLSNMLKEYDVEVKPTPTHQSKYEIKSNKLPFAKREEITKKLESLGYEVQGDGNGNLNIWNSLNENQYNNKRNDWIINDFLGQYGYNENLSPEERAVIAKILRLK